MKLEEIEEFWNNDTRIMASEENARENSLRVALLHSKYANILWREERLLIKLKDDYNKLKKVKYEQLMHGYQDRKDQENDPDMPSEGALLKSSTTLERETYLDANSQLSELRVKKELCELKIKKLERILLRINALHWDFKNYISIKQFENGR